VGLGRGSGPAGYAMPESPLLFSAVVPACGFCLKVQSRSRGVKESRSGKVESNRRPARCSRGVKESRSWEANRRPHFSGRSLGRRRAIPGLPDLSIYRSRNLASDPGGTTPKKHKNNTNEASMLLKTQGAFSKLTQNEANFERQMHKLNPKTEPAGRLLISAEGLCLRNAAGFGIDPLAKPKKRERIQNLGKQSQQVIENKRCHLRTCQRSGNLYENTGPYCNLREYH